MNAFSERLDLNLHIPLLLHSVFAQTTISLVKVNLSYRALELGLPPLWIGMISATFAIVPIFIGLWIGRFIDRGNDALAVWIGSSVALLACAAFSLLPATTFTLFAGNIALGLGHMFFMAGGQMVCERSGRGGARELAFGNYMVANAIGSGLGPLILGILAGGSKIPDTSQLFYICFLGATATFALALFMRPSIKDRASRRNEQSISVGELLRMPAMLLFIFSSVMTITSQDLLSIYLPLLALERHIEASHVGLALTVRAVSTMIARIMYAKAMQIFGRVPLMVTTISGGAVGMLLLGLPLPTVFLYIACAIIGFCLGFAATATLTAVVSTAPAAGRATAVTLRIMGNRVGQIGLPLTGGLVATMLGAGGVFAITATGLCVAALGIYRNRHAIRI